MGVLQEGILLMLLMVNTIKFSNTSHHRAANSISTTEFGARMKLPNVFSYIQVRNGTVHKANSTLQDPRDNVSQRGTITTSPTEISDRMAKAVKIKTFNDSRSVQNRKNQRDRLAESGRKTFQRSARIYPETVRNSAQIDQVRDRTKVQIVPRVKPPIQLKTENNSTSKTSTEVAGLSFSDSQDLIHSDNTQYSKVHPNFTLNSGVFERHLKNDEEQSAASRFANIQDKLKKDTTFFFTHVGPHSFEYRAMFQHGKNEFHVQNNFQPFSEFSGFPKIPFPQFPSFPEIFSHKAHFPELPPFEFPIPTPSPIKRVLHQPLEENQLHRPALNDHFDDPFKQYDVVLGDLGSKYPKIFRFNEERMNIEDFDRQKKLQAKLNNLNSNNILEPENVKRGQMLILHGGIFTVQEPPLYSRSPFRKKMARQRDIYRISNPQIL